MRKIEILNKNYETVGLFVTLVNGKNYKDLFDVYGSTADDTQLQGIATANNVSLYQVKYWYDAYLYMRYQILKEGKTYNKTGPSKYDVAYVNKTIDDPIAELNGHTLREVFEDNNQAFGEVLNDRENLLSGDNYIILTKEIDVVQNNQFYIRIKFETNSTINVNLIRAYYGSLYLDGTVFTYDINVEEYELSTLFNTENTDSIRIYLRNSVTGSNYYPLEAYYIDFGILGLNNLTKEQIDYYYSLYQARKNITKKVLTYADVFEDYQELLNNDFENDVNSWDCLSGDNLIWEDGKAKTVKGNDPSAYLLIRQTNELERTTDYYVAVKVKNNSSIERFRLTFNTYNAGISINSIENNSVYSNIGNTGEYNNFQIYNYSSVGFTNGDSFTLDVAFAIPIKHFDELITKEQLDTMLAHYLLVKNIVIYPEIYVPTDPTGFGNRYAFLELNKKVYDHELDFENMQLNILFGLYRNAYDSFNLMMRFLTSNEAIIAYDWGKGVRYTDVRLSAAPKTELESGQILRSKFEFKRSNPFYELVEENSQLSLKNDTQLPIPLKITIEDITADIVEIELENNVTGDIDFYIKFDFSNLPSTPEQVIVDSENKKILINGENIGYQYLVLGEGKNSFISIPNDSETYVTYATGTDKLIFNYKKWVID